MNTGGATGAGKRKAAHFEQVSIARSKDLTDTEKKRNNLEIKAVPSAQTTKAQDRNPSFKKIIDAHTKPALSSAGISKTAGNLQRTKPLFTGRGGSQLSARSTAVSTNFIDC